MAAAGACIVALMPEPGVLEYKLFDGACIVDTFVEAPPERAAEAFGEAVKLAENGKPIEGVDRSAVRFYSASWPGVSWSVIETVGGEDAEADYILTMLRQAAAALEGNVLTLPAAYENGLGLARDAARALNARAMVVWGSDEWNSLGGGAQFDPAGEVIRACNIADPSGIAKALADRESMDDPDAEFEDDEDFDEDESALFVYSPGAPLAKQTVDALEYIDGWLKQCGIPQPEMPPSLLDAAAGYFGEVWGARPK